MIRWKECERTYSKAARERFRRSYCNWERRVDGTCMGVSQDEDDDEPHDVCKACDALMGGDAE